MRKQLVLSSLIMAISFGSAASANDKSVLENFYVKSNDSVVSESSLSLGYRPLSSEGILKKARFEQEVSHSVSFFDESSLDKTKIMSNFMYDFEKHGSITPYMGVGVGVTHFSNYDEKSASDTLPTYQVMTGVSYDSVKHPQIKMRMGYSYSDTISETASDNDVRYKQDNIDNGAHAVAAYIDFSF